MTEDEMVGWHHRLSGHEIEQTRGDGEGQGGLVCCSPWGRKEWDATECLNNSSVDKESRLCCNLVKSLPFPKWFQSKIVSNCEGVWPMKCQMAK